MNRTMQAARLYAIEDIRIDEVEVPELEQNQVLVKVMAVGVCGSDVHYFRHGHIGQSYLQGPLILGHELSGVIAAVGSSDLEHRIGQRVAVEPQKPCRTCDQCKSGRYNLCRSMEFYATPPIDGAFSEFAAIESDFAIEIPDSMSFEAAALLEPLSVAIWSCQKAKIAPGSRVLITGAGPIGLVSIMAALAYGATEITVTDIDESKLALAAKLGATKTVNVQKESIQDVRVDAFIEASGAASAIESGIRAVDKNGVAVLVGLGSDSVALPISHIMNNEIWVTGIYRYTNTWPIAIDLAASGQADLDSLVTSRFSLSETADALRASGSLGEIKPVVLPNS